MVITRRLKRYAAIVAIGGLLLNAATPLIADAAAALTGVPTGEICDVYGVRLPTSSVPHVHDAALAMGAASSHPLAQDDEAFSAAMDHGSMGHESPGRESPGHDSMPDGSLDHGALADAASGPADPDPAPAHRHASGLHAGDHCALTALATFAPPALAAAVAEPATDPLHHASTARLRAPLFDAVSRWALGHKTGPPSAA